MNQEVVIPAPTAVMNFNSVNPTQEEIAKSLVPPSPQEIIQAQDIEIRHLHNEMAKLRTGASTIANATIALLHLYGEAINSSVKEVKIPMDLRLKLEGAQVQLREENGEITLSYSERANDVVWDGRTD